MAGSSSSSGQLPLTFGLEVEFLYGIRRGFESAYPHHWWLRPESLSMEDPNNANLVELGDEIQNVPTSLWQAAKIFASKGGELSIIGENSTDTYEKLERWILTTEAAVVTPYSGQEMERFSSGVLGEHEDPDDWDWAGLELISPVLPVPDLNSESFRPNGLVQLRAYLKFMNQELPPEVPYVLLAHPEVTSVHVHVGIRPEKSGQIEFPLGMLRHIAFLSVFFEDALTLLHHPQRQTYPDSKCREYAMPNRHVLMAEHSKDSVHVCNEDREFSPIEAFLKIFNYHHDEDHVARRQLCDELSSKKSYHEGPIAVTDILRALYVNFENIANASSKADKRTVEFRQHHGTSSSEDVEQWVVFVTALVRAAEKLWKAPGNPQLVSPRLGARIYKRYKHDPAKRDRAMTEASKYTHLLRENRRTLKQLFDMLELAVPRRSYWWHRAKAFRAEFARDWAGLSHSICDTDCGLPAIRDCEGWEEGELDNPPWDDADADAEYEEEASENESVAMEVDNDVPEPDDLLRQKSIATPTPSLVADDSETESEDMDIDNDVPSPKAVNPAVTIPEDVMSIANIVHHDAGSTNKKRKVEEDEEDERKR